MSQAGLNNANNIPPPPGSVTELQGNTGPIVPPDGSGVIHLEGAILYTTDGDAGTNTLTINPRVNAYPITPYVVGPIGEAGYQTITDAVSAVQLAGHGTIYIQQGSYTEDLTFIATTDIELVGLGEVVITGRHRCGNATNLTCTHISFISTTDIFFSTAPVGTATITCVDCNFACNGYIYNLPQWIPGGHLNLIDCTDTGSVSNNVINNTFGAAINISGCNFIANGTLFNIIGGATVQYSTFAIPIAFSSLFNCFQCNFELAVTANLGSVGDFRECIIKAPVTGPALLCNTGLVNKVNLINSTIDSPTSPAIDGTGSISLQNVFFINNATVAGTLSVTTYSWQPYSQAIAATDGAKVGTAAFNSSQFTVDTKGFVSLIGGGVAADSFAMQSGTNPVVPTAAGLVTFNGAVVAAGTNPVRTDGTGANTMALEVQISQAIAAADATKIGLAAFNSSQFTVDANGFVSSMGNTVTWQTISANQTLVKNNGYICISPGGALSLALPSTASSTIGDIIEVTLDGATSWTITQAASQQIRFSGSQTTAGVGGSLASTATGDTIRMVYQATGKWNVISSIGNLTVT